MFSIITVARENRAGLAKTHESIKTQSFQGFEWIVIDGGSQDGTATYLEATPAKWTSAPDRGIYDAMNKGIEKASGDYLLFLNAGDILPTPDTLEKISAEIKKQSPAPDFIYGDSIEGTFYKPARAPAAKMRGMFTHHQSMLYRRGALEGLRYDLHYKIAGDYDFTCRFLQQPRATLYCPFPFCVFESGGLSQQMARTARREEFFIRKKMGVQQIGNCSIYAAQSAAWVLRKKLPRVYWKLKSSYNSGSGSART